jgi:hypothetical protein
LGFENSDRIDRKNDVRELPRAAPAGTLGIEATKRWLVGRGPAVTLKLSNGSFGIDPKPR